MVSVFQHLHCTFVCRGFRKSLTHCITCLLVSSLVALSLVYYADLCTSRMKAPKKAAEAIITGGSVDCEATIKTLGIPALSIFL